MNELLSHIPFNIYSSCAISSARRYLDLIEKQLLQAQTDDLRDALNWYLSSANHDEIEHEINRHDIDSYYEIDYRPILYFTTVVYLYMIFEKFIYGHVADIQRHFKEDPEILKKLIKKQCLVKSAQAYFRDKAKLSFFSDEQWSQLLEISHVRNCIVHNAGIPRDTIEKYRGSIYALENRMWQGRLVGLQIDRYEGRDLGCPMVLNQRFLEYCLSVLEDFFNTLGAAAEAEMGK